MTEPDPRQELERLRRENDALNEQVKLLVQTEQRLYRSQAQLDAQLLRQRSLARFALESTGSESVEAILDRAMGVLAEGFGLDWIAVIRQEPAERAVTLIQVFEGPPLNGPPTPIDADIWQFLTDRTEAVILHDVTEAEPGPAGRLIRALAPASIRLGNEVEHGRFACLPLRSVGDSRPGAIVTFVARRIMGYARQEALRPESLPFIQLLTNHLDREIAGARLTASLRERTAQLSTSLARLEATQRELFQAQKLEAVGRLAGGVAHDFNNLLTVILGYAGTLYASLPPGSRPQENVRRILEAGRRAADITAQLLALGRRQVQRREPFDLSEQAERTVDLLRRLVGEHIRLEIEFDRGLPPVNADRAQIEQVMLNLLVNARDAMCEGGLMRVLTRPATLADAARCDEAVDPRHFAALDVVDSGVGMDDTVRQRIFEPFFTTKGAGKGSGLGLAVVYGIVKQSEGHVLVESQPGRGSRFTVLLPTAPRKVEPVRPPEPTPLPEAAPAAPLTRGTILVVEDEPVIREVIVMTLCGAGHTVHEAGHGEEALARIDGSGPGFDLVLTDVVMPRMGGLKLAEQLALRWPGTRVAFMSGYSEDLVADDGPSGDLEAPFLAKPFSPRELLDFVDRQLDRAAAPSRDRATGSG